MDQIDALAKLLRTSASLLRRLMLEDGLGAAASELTLVSRDIDEAARRIERVVAAGRGEATEDAIAPRFLS